MTLRRGRPMRQVSVKKAARDAEFEVNRQLRRGQAKGFCEAQSACGKTFTHNGSHAHHVKLRSQGGGHEVDNLLWVCWDAHDWIHANPAAAAALGYIARRS